MREIADRVPQPFLRWVALYMEGMMAQFHGRLEEADELLEDAVGVGTEGDQPDAVLFYAVQLCAVRYDQGRVDEVIDLVAESVEENPGLPAWRGFHAAALCELGREDEARPMLAARRFDALPHDFLRLAGLAYWAEACARVGEAEFAGDLYAQLEPFRDQVIDTGVHVVGSASHYLGLLAAALGDHERAGRDFEAATAAYRRMDAPVMLARTEEAWARSLLDTGRADDRERASALLESALTRAREYGADGIARRVEKAVA
jgi:tetratricopeptide (TPR) repeat protein